MNENNEELMLDLLTKQAVYGLSDAETKQLRDLERKLGGENAGSFEATAAMIAIIGVDLRDQMPAHVRAKISDAADEYFDSLAAPAVTDKRAVIRTRPQRSFMDWFGWAVAAAACVALAFNIYFTRVEPTVGQIDVPTPRPEEKLTSAQMRERLMETAPDLMRASWSGGKEFASVSGDVVWSDRMQAGYMRFTGLPANDSSLETYQLWLFDENQGDKTPIDGGTFDVSANGEVIVPITAHLRAKNPKMFAITVEKPGGVVVSKREKVAAIAKVQA
ncbi:MAG TPA: anti-sigma factor [Pyrinomonadaceae bacterium]|nr:anti-sigma factor [Pyrinomonadaceae bacterium]